jgi:hypothetical protein
LSVNLFTEKPNGTKIIIEAGSMLACLFCLIKNNQNLIFNKFQASGKKDSVEKLELEPETEDENPERGNWTGKLDFLLSLLGYAVGEMSYLYLRFCLRLRLGFCLCLCLCLLHLYLCLF